MLLTEDVGLILLKQKLTYFKDSIKALPKYSQTFFTETNITKRSWKERQHVVFIKDIVFYGRVTSLSVYVDQRLS